MFHRLRSITVLFGIVFAGMPISGSDVLAQELSVEIPVVGGGQGIDLSRQGSNAPAELPKASGFEELTAPNEPVLPYVEKDSETDIVPPPAKLVDPTPEEPKAKAATKPKAPAKPKAATKPKATAKPKAAVKPKAVAKPKTAVKPKAAVEPKAVAKPKTAVKPKLAVPLPRVKPESVLTPPIAAKKTTPTKAAKTNPDPVEDIPLVGVEVAPQIVQPTPLPRETPKSILTLPTVVKKTTPTRAAKTDPLLTEDAPFVDVDAAPKIEQPTPLPRGKPKSILAPPLAATKTTPTKAAKADSALTEDAPFVDSDAAPQIEQPKLEADPFGTLPAETEKTVLGEPTELVKFKTGPIVQLPEVTSGPIAPVSTVDTQERAAPKQSKRGKADRIDRN